jgi:hypothetical protein
MDADPKHASLVSVVVRVCNKEQGRRLRYTSTEGVLDRLGRVYDMSSLTMAAPTDRRRC